MTRLTVADGQAVNVGTRQYHEGETFDHDDDREAALWLEGQLVMPAKPPAKTKASVRKAR